MKRIFPAILILVIIIISYVASYIYINKVCEIVDGKIDDCIKAYEENKNIKLCADDLNVYWSKKEKILSIFVNHELIDKIELSISNLKLHSNFEGNEMFYDACDTTKILLHQIVEDTKITAHSVFW